MAVALSLPALGQVPEAAPRTATIMGTVTDANGDVIPNATIVLKEVEGNDPRTILTAENGMFEFHDVTPGITYQLRISAKDFADWTSTPIAAVPWGQRCSLSQIPQAISLPRFRLSAFLKLCSVVAVSLTIAVGCKKQLRLCVSHCDRHVMPGDIRATIFLQPETA